MSKVTTASCVQEKGLSHSTGFPLKLVSIVPHFGASFSRTRETATLVKENSLSVSRRPLTHPFSFPSSYLSIHTYIHPSSIFSSTYSSFHSCIHSTPSPPSTDPCMHASIYPCILAHIGNFPEWKVGDLGKAQHSSSLLSPSCPSYSWEEGSVSLSISSASFH